MVDMSLSLHELLVLIFQTDEPILEVNDLWEALVVSRFVINDTLEEGTEDLMSI